MQNFIDLASKYSIVKSIARPILYFRGTSALSYHSIHIIIIVWFYSLVRTLAKSSRTSSIFSLRSMFDFNEPEVCNSPIVILVTPSVTFIIDM